MRIHTLAFGVDCVLLGRAESVVLIGRRGDRARLLFLLLWFKAGAPRAEHYQLVRTLLADAVVTVL